MDENFHFLKIPDYFSPNFVLESMLWWERETILIILFSCEDQAIGEWNNTWRTPSAAMPLGLSCLFLFLSSRSEKERIPLLQDQAMFVRCWEAVGVASWMNEWMKKGEFTSFPSFLYFCKLFCWQKLEEKVSLFFWELIYCSPNFFLLANSISFQIYNSV